MPRTISGEPIKSMVSVEDLPKVLDVREMMAVKGGGDSKKCSLGALGIITICVNGTSGTIYNPTTPSTPSTPTLPTDTTMTNPTDTTTTVVNKGQAGNSSHK